MFGVTRWWYDKGVAGFRLDAVDTLFEDPNLHDNPVLPGKNAFGDPKMKNEYNDKLPEVHDVLQGLAQGCGPVQRGADRRDLDDEHRRAQPVLRPTGNELQMPMDFMFTTVNKLSPPEFRKQIAAVNSASGWPVYVISNHDIERSYNRYGDGKHNDEIAKVMAGTVSHAAWDADPVLRRRDRDAEQRSQNASRT